MYLIGAPHPNKEAAVKVVERLIQKGERLVTDVEVFQEILHRYSSIGRPEFIEPAFDLLRSLADEIFSIEMATVETAQSLLVQTSGLSARDAIHLASMRVHRIPHIFTFDKGFDGIVGVRRVSFD